MPDPEFAVFWSYKDEAWVQEKRYRRGFTSPQDARIAALEIAENAKYPMTIFTARIVREINVDVTRSYEREITDELMI